MDIILRILNRTTQEVLFIDDNLKTFGQEDILSLLKQQNISSLFSAKRNGKVYIKSKPNTKGIEGATVKRCIQISTEFYQMAKSILL